MKGQGPDMTASKYGNEGRGESSPGMTQQKNSNSMKEFFTLGENE